MTQYAVYLFTSFSKYQQIKIKFQDVYINLERTCCLMHIFHVYYQVFHITKNTLTLFGYEEMKIIKLLTVISTQV